MNTGRYLSPRANKKGKAMTRPRLSDVYYDDDLEDLVDANNYPERGGMRANHRARKELSDRIQPLFRFLKSCVGQPWNQVYSEICQNVPKDSVMNLHLHEHVEAYVQEGCEYRDGKLVQLKTGMETYRLRRETLYTDKDGILRLAVPVPYKKELDTSDFHYISKDTVLLKVEGVWYMYKYEYVQRTEIPLIIPLTPFYPSEDDMKIIDRVKYQFGLPTDGVWKRHKQLSSKEIKKFGLA